MIELIWIILPVAIILITVYSSISWYRIVPPSEAHLVTTPRGRFVASSDEKVATKGKRSYFKISDWIPFFGRRVRVMDITIKEIIVIQETYEKNQARYSVRSSTKYRIKDVITSAETFISTKDLEEQLSEIVSASVRAITVKYDVVEARANKQLMSTEIRKEMEDDLSKWGLELVNFQLVDFQDTKDSAIISDISKRREVEIEAQTREQNAEKRKQAKIKEAEADEKSQQREIERDRTVGVQEQLRDQKIAEQRKLAKIKEYEVKQVEIIKQAEIDKEKAIVVANQAKETEKIYKEQKELEGQGDRLRAEERAKGDASPIREKGFAEAQAKEKLQEALNKFGPEAITALVAEKVVEMQRAVGIETAKALSTADIKLFAGGKAGEQGFDLGQLIGAVSVTNESLAKSVLNKIARPNDLGFAGYDFELKDGKMNIKEKPTGKVTSKTEKGKA